jgi:hypothetical protein
VTCSTSLLLRYLLAASMMCHHSSGSSIFQLTQIKGQSGYFRKFLMYGNSFDLTHSVIYYVDAKNTGIKKKDAALTGNF